MTTTTERLAEELSHYMPKVFINRNRASEFMAALSEEVLKKPPAKISGEVVLGYFSGSITHNDDYAMILPVLVKILEKYENTKLLVVGELDLPRELLPFKARVIVKPFVDFVKLPELIASADINLVPLLDNIFNEAKSENKWVEAALVKIPTVASNVGAFKKMMRDGQTGFLCNDSAEWEEKLSCLIERADLRGFLAENAYEFVHENCLTTVKGMAYVEFIRDNIAPSVALLFPSFEVSGGVLVALKHIEILRRHGYDATAVNLDERELRKG